MDLYRLSRVNIVSFVVAVTILAGAVVYETGQKIGADVNPARVTIQAVVQGGGIAAGDIANVFLCCYGGPPFYSATLSVSSPSVTFTLPVLRGPVDFYTGVALPDPTLTLLSEPQQHFTIAHGYNVTITYTFNKPAPTPPPVIESPPPVVVPSPTPTPTVTTATSNALRPKPKKSAFANPIPPKQTPSPTVTPSPISVTPPALSPVPQQSLTVVTHTITPKKNRIQAFFAALRKLFFFWE